MRHDLSGRPDGARRQPRGPRTLTRRALLASAGAAALGLGACAQAPTSEGDGDAPAGTGTPATVSFVLDYAPNVNHTGIYVALERGWFAEEGIDVEVVPAPADGADALIGSGGADLGVSYQDYLANSLASASPLPYTAVAAIVQHNTSGIMSRAEDAITSARGMEGHRYATWGMPVEQATIRRIVEADGGDYSRVELVPYEVDDDVMGLRTGLFDAVWVYEWWAVQSARLQGFAVNYFAFADMDPVFDYYTPVIAANDAWARDNPELLRGFLRAARRGYEFSAERPAEAAEILCAAVPELDAELVTAAQASISPEYVADAGAWGDIDATRWARFYEWLNDEGLVEREIATDSGFTTDYLA